MKIKIVYIIDFLESKEGVIGGTEKQLIETVKRLDNTKFEPIIVVLRKWGRNEVGGNLQCNKKVLHIYSLKSIKTVFSFLAFVRYLRRESPDIVFTYFFDSTLFGVLAAKVVGVKTIISCRRDLGFWKDPSVGRWLSLTNRLTDRFLVNCEAIQNAMAIQENIPVGNIDVIQNGIDVFTIKNTERAWIYDEYPQIGPDDSLIGIVANFNRRVKRLDLFIEAAAEVVKRRNDVKFIIIGGGRRNEAELTELAKTKGIADHVIFGGFKEDPLPYVKNFDIGVLSSDSEGLSNTILEYMAAGIPCVATDTGGNKELVENGVTGILVPTGQPVALADALCWLLDDKERGTTMAAEAKRRVAEKYAWDVIIRRMEDYYQDLVKQ